MLWFYLFLLTVNGGSAGPPEPLEIRLDRLESEYRQVKREAHIQKMIRDHERFSLSVILALLALIGFGGVKFISDSIQNRVRCGVEEATLNLSTSITAEICNMVFYWHYLQDQMEGVLGRKEVHLEVATNIAWKGYHLMQQPFPGDARYTRVRMQTINHLAYILAMRNVVSECEFAVRLAVECYEYSLSKPNLWYEFQDTFVYVNLVFKKDLYTRENCREILNTMLGDPTIPGERRHQLYLAYKDHPNMKLENPFSMDEEVNG